MKKAFDIANFNVLRVLNDATACGMAYKLSNIETSDEIFVLVFDFGMSLKMSVLGI